MPQQLLIRGGQPGHPPAVPVECGAGGATVANSGPSWPVYYRDELPVSATLNDGSIASGASVTLYGAQYLTVDRGDFASPVDTATVFVSESTVSAAGGVLNVKSGFNAKGDGVGDDTVALQAALDAANAAGGGHIYVPAGTYLLTASLTIGSNTTLELAAKATIRRNAAIDNMLRNKSDGTTGGYGQASNIEVRGGVWDANGAGQASNVTALAFGHAQYVRLVGVTVTNVIGWHCLELNAVQHAVVRDCVLRDHVSSTTNEEMLQIDLMAGSGQFPWFGPYDNTACDDLLITGCTVTNGPRGIGSHSAVSGTTHNNIRIVGNHFSNLREEVLYVCDWQRVLVSGNTITDCWKTMIVKSISSPQQACKDFTIVDNVMSAFKASPTLSRGVHFDGNDVTNRYMQDIVIGGNTITGCNQHAIGVDYCQHVSIRGNVCHDNGGAGIYVFRCRWATVNGNVCRANNSASNGYDLQVGTTSGTATDTSDTMVSGNIVTAGNIFGYTTRTLLVGNNFTTTLIEATSPAPTAYSKAANLVNGTYTA